MVYKLPRSVQVVVFAETERGREYLLLRRVVSLGGFWQTVTGSLEEGETHRRAAIRELREETGITAAEVDLIDLGLTNTFEIAPHWRAKYSPGVTHNEEVCFALRVGKCDVVIDTVEHDAYDWVEEGQALHMLYWESTQAALRVVSRLFNGL
ncbi:MAG TPA: dihydroneopterin triphosphate diphosphatase [Blastocatellia bacterium]|nr:dihydroneopterin triphosphate diphosphatase [Blastocatellia bacterium]